MLASLPHDAKECAAYLTQCTACRAVASEIQQQFERGDASRTIEAGSFRLSGSGKQAGLRKVPYRGSELHVSTVLDGACDGLSLRYARFESRPDVFVPSALAADVAPTVNDCRLTRALDGVCTRITDEHEEEIGDALRGRESLDEDEWAMRLCGAQGIVDSACAPDVDPGRAADVVGAMRVERDNATVETQDDGRPIEAKSEL